MKTITNRKYKVMLPLLVIGLAILFSFSIQSVSADPSQIYVNTSGNDNYNGESPVFISGDIGPKKTIKNATKTVINDGTLHIASGTYNENNIADFSKNINFIGEDKHKTKIDGNKLGGLFSLGAQGATYSYSFTNLQFLNGSAGNGGAIANTCGNIFIDNCIFKNNIASYAGGAVFSFGTGGSPATLNIINSNFTNNSAPNGVIYNALSSVSVTGSDFTNNTGTTTKILWNTFGQISNFQFNRIIGTGNLITSDQGGDVSLNWWGSNIDPSAKVSGVTVGPWIVLNATANPTTIATGATSTVTADLQHDSNGAYYDPAFGHVPDGILVNFANDTLGTVNPLVASMINGAVSTTFTAVKTGNSIVTTTVDAQTATANVNIITSTPPVVTSSNPLNNTVNVAINKVITITFSKAIKFGINSWIEFKNASGTAIPFTSSILGNVLSLTPNALLAYGTTYTVILHSNSVTDLAGTGLAAPYTTKFTTITPQPPVVTSTSPVNNAINVAINKVININFNQAIKYGTNPWIELKNSSGTAKPFTSKITGSTLNITSTTPYAKGTKYTVIIHSNAVTDSTGTAGLAAPYTTKFTTA